MLQQTQVHTVIPYWERWMRELPTVEALAGARSGRIHKLWEGLGYYTRVRNMQKAARLIVEKHGGSFPAQHEEILALPGVGRYTAGAICSIAYNQPEPILDGNVARVLARVFGIEGNPRERATNDRLWQLAGELVGQASVSKPGGNACSRFNQGLMELGALICTPRNPRCGLCPVKRTCVALREERVSELPNLGPRPIRTARRFVGFILEQDGCVLVRQRPAGVVNAHLWEFPNIEAANGNTDARKAARGLFGKSVEGLRLVCSIKHSITRYRMTLDVFTAVIGVGKDFRAPTGAEWISRKAVGRLAFPTAHRKALFEVLRSACA